MRRTRPSVASAMARVYWDLYLVLRTAWRPALIVAVVLSIGLVAALIVPLWLTRDPMGQTVARLVIWLGLGFLVTPYLLAVHRLVLLGELPVRYGLSLSSPRGQLFFSWLSLGILVLSVPSVLDALTMPKGPVYYYVGQAPARLGGSWVVVAAHAAALVIVQRLLVLFPAVAVDAPGATWQNAFRDTSRHFWFFFALTTLPFLPIGLLGGALVPLLGLMGKGTLTGLIANTLWLGTMLFAVLTLAGIIAARLYQVVGDRLNTGEG